MRCEDLALEIAAVKHRQADLVSPATAFYFTMADEEVEEGVSTMAVDGDSAQSKNAAKKARQKAKKAAEAAKKPTASHTQLIGSVKVLERAIALSQGIVCKPSN